MKKIISIVTLVLFSSFLNAADVASLQVSDKSQIDSILSSYALFSNKILAKGLAFGFSPAVQRVDISFAPVIGHPEFTECEIILEATLGALENGQVVPVGAEVRKPKQSYVEEGHCQDIKDTYLL